MQGEKKKKIVKSLSKYDPSRSKSFFHTGPASPQGHIFKKLSLSSEIFSFGRKETVPSFMDFLKASGVKAWAVSTTVGKPLLTEVFRSSKPLTLIMSKIWQEGIIVSSRKYHIH